MLPITSVLVSNYSPDVEESIAAIRRDVTLLHAELVRYGLVVWTGGNVSARVPGADLFVIKPSGVGYDDLAPENMILCDLEGVPVGAVWSRLYPTDAPGYGFVAEDVPELGIGVLDGYRGRGIGRALLEAMIAATPGDLSLSVEDGNPAIELYRSAGFTAVGRFGDATTMLRTRL